MVARGQIMEAVESLFELLEGKEDQEALVTIFFIHK